MEKCRYPFGLANLKLLFCRIFILSFQLVVLTVQRNLSMIAPVLCWKKFNLSVIRQLCRLLEFGKACIDSWGLWQSQSLTGWQPRQITHRFEVRVRAQEFFSFLLQMKDILLSADIRSNASVYNPKWKRCVTIGLTIWNPSCIWLLTLRDPQ